MVLLCCHNERKQIRISITTTVCCNSGACALFCALSHVSFNSLNSALVTHVKWTCICRVKRFRCCNDINYTTPTAEYRGVVTFFSSGLQPKSRRLRFVWKTCFEALAQDAHCASFGDYGRGRPIPSKDVCKAIRWGVMWGYFQQTLCTYACWWFRHSEFSNLLFILMS